MSLENIVIIGAKENQIFGTYSCLLYRFNVHLYFDPEGFESNRRRAFIRDGVKPENIHTTQEMDSSTLPNAEFYFLDDIYTEYDLTLRLLSAVGIKDKLYLVSDDKPTLEKYRREGFNCVDRYGIEELVNRKYPEKSRTEPVASASTTPQI